MKSILSAGVSERAVKLPLEEQTGIYMVREAEFRAQQLQGGANKLAGSQSCWNYGGYFCSISSETLHRAWKRIPAALFSAIPPAPCLNKGENFNYCSFCIKHSSWYRVCLLSLELYVAQRFSVLQSCLGEREGRWWVFWKHFGGGNTLSALSEGEVEEKLTGLALLWKYHMVFIHSLPLTLSDGRSGGAMFWFSPCTRACRRITGKEKLVVKIDH